MFAVRFILSAFALIILSSPVCAQISADDLEDGTNWRSKSPVFARQYILVESIKNYPLQKSLDRFTPYRRTLGLTYLHRLNDDWIVGLSVYFKSLRKQPQDSEFAFSSASNIAQYVVRLNHPVYLLVGGKWLYMLPVQYARFPLVKDTEFELEFGVAATMSLVYNPTGKWLFNLRMDRWRGTKTNRFHGIETAFGIARSF